MAQISGQLKKIYRSYNAKLLDCLMAKGFTDLRPSFLDVLLFISENDGPSIKLIGHNVGLKKQTMTSHLNEIEKRGYIYRQVDLKDKREQNIYLTDYGNKFKLALFDSLEEIESEFNSKVGEIELARLELILKNVFEKIS